MVHLGAKTLVQREVRMGGCGDELKDQVGRLPASPAGPSWPRDLEGIPGGGVSFHIWAGSAGGVLTGTP